MNISIDQVSESRIQTNKKTEDFLRNYWKLRTDIWFDVFKPHREDCTCCYCSDSYFEFFDWRFPGPHSEFCDCDFCMPSGSPFCACEECIPDIIAFDMIGQVPLVQPPHSEHCECYWCKQKSETGETYDNNS